MGRVPGHALGAPKLSRIDGMPHDAQLAALDELTQRVTATNAFQRGRLEGARIRTLDELRRLPFMTKHELLLDQATTPPYGTNVTFPIEEYTHLHLTSGTMGEQLRVLQTAEDWQTTRRCFALVLSEVGITAADRVALPFPFGAYLQFWAAAGGVEEVGALALRSVASRAASDYVRSPSSRRQRLSARPRTRSRS